MERCHLRISMNYTLSLEKSVKTNALHKISYWSIVHCSDIDYCYLCRIYYGSLDSCFQLQNVSI